MGLEGIQIESTNQLGMGIVDECCEQNPGCTGQHIITLEISNYIFVHSVVIMLDTDFLKVVGTY